MPIVNGYATLAEVKEWVGIDALDVTHDAFYEARVNAISRFVDEHCGRHFFTIAETRRFTAFGCDGCYIDDLDVVTSVKIDSDGDATFETTLAAADYILKPFDRKRGGVYTPWTEILKATDGSTFFPELERGVEIAGTWGWESVPLPIREATLMLVARIGKRKDSPLGVAGGEEFDPQRIVATDPDVRMMLEPFKKGPTVG